MKNRLLLLLSSVLLLLLSGCATSSSMVDMHPLGKTYQGTVDLRDIALPLPEGEWKVVGRGLRKDFIMSALILERDIANKPHSLIYIERDTPISNRGSHAIYGGGGWKKNQYLERKDMLHVVVLQNQQSGWQDGWLINHIRAGSDLKSVSPDADEQLLKHILDNKLVTPGNYIKTFHVFSGEQHKDKHLEYSILVNPEVYGFDPPANAEWASSDWNILKINNDPKKVAFIEKLKDEGTAFHQKLREAFGK